MHLRHPAAAGSCARPVYTLSLTRGSAVEKLRLEGEGKKVEQVGLAQARATEARVNAFGGPQYQLMQQVMARFPESVERGQIDIVPKVMVGGGAIDGKDGLLSGNMLGALMAMMLSAQGGAGPLIEGKEQAQKPYAGDPRRASLSVRIGCGWWRAHRCGSRWTSPRREPLTGGMYAMRRRMHLLRSEWPLLVSVATTVLFMVFGRSWLADLSGFLWFAFMLVWLFCTILLSAFALVRHAESLAVRLGEPLGTLVLTLAVTGLEVMMIAAVMYTSQGDSSLARDTMFAVVMIVLNGLVGLCLLLGGLRYHEQTYNLYGANAFLAVIVPLAVLGMVLPTFTASSPGPTFSPLQAVFLIVISTGLYGVFLAIQTLRHRDYFVAPASPGAATEHAGDEAHDGLEIRSAAYHTVLLIANLLPVVVLAKQLAVPIHYGIANLGAPPALGGLLVAALILSPESLAAIRAARANQLQRSINLSLGSVLATISLTVPAVLTIGFLTGKTIVLGLGAVDMTLLLLTLVVSILTFALERTNVLLGAVHLLLFLAYLMLMFEK